MDILIILATVLFALFLVRYDGILHELQRAVIAKSGMLRPMVKMFDGLKHHEQTGFIGMYMLSVSYIFAIDIWSYLLNLLCHLFTFSVVFSPVYNKVVLEKDLWYLGKGSWDARWKSLLGEKIFLAIRIILWVSLIYINFIWLY